jgi:hypothetical protein
MKYARGLGLLELLVALLLVTLSASLVVQGIGQGLGMLRRVATDQGVAYHELMARAWLRESIGAAAASATQASVGEDDVEPVAEKRAVDQAIDEAPAAPDFAGTSTEFTMQSFRPLLGSEGIATPITWRAEPERGMRYIEAEQQVEVTALPELQRIEYQGSDGSWYNSWPPPERNSEATETPSSPLPLRVRLVFPGDDRLDVLLLARHSPRADTETETETDDAELDSE